MLVKIKINEFYIYMRDNMVEHIEFMINHRGFCKYTCLECIFNSSNSSIDKTNRLCIKHRFSNKDANIISKRVLDIYNIISNTYKEDWEENI